MLDIAVVLFLFKRNKAVEVIRRIAEVQPQRLYLIADGGRTEKEQQECLSCRKAVEEAITWPCTVIKNYANKNRGVFENIGLGSLWVFKHEDKAIFLEDDNLPEITFFDYCRELLMLYEKDTRVLWICGTNYLGQYNPMDKSSYVFTRHMLPCGWASWGDKFKKYYNPYIAECNDKILCKKIKAESKDKVLYKQFFSFWRGERKRIEHNLRPLSWDYQMDFSIKSNGLYGISPCNNQIQNIGVDNYSIHGGSSNQDVMTRRFCTMQSIPMQFPLKHPTHVMVDPVYEKRISKIIKYPLSLRFRNKVVRIARTVLRVPFGSSLHIELKERMKKCKNGK